VENFDSLLQSAHFSRLTKAEWDTAVQEDFTVRASLLGRQDESK
jgi:hypothetical protein